jgi:hypothetical protein
VEINNLRILALERFAHKIPDLGKGGKTIKEYLTLSGVAAESGTSIIDIGPFMGSTTSYLALGCNISKNDIELHAIDVWLADKDYVERSKIHLDFELQEGEDIKFIWEKNISPFCSETFQIFGHKKSILDFRYESKRPISVYVDDICNNKEKHDYSIKTFSPFFIPNRTVLYLMDYFFYERKPSASLKYQRIFMDLNSHVFLNVGRCGRTHTAVFIYLGGHENIVYPEVSYEKA